MEVNSGKAKGGFARAEALTPEERKAIAKRAAEARWSGESPGHAYPKATHRGVLTIADVELPCFVLDDGRRVISGRGMTAAIGMKGRGQGAQRIVEHRTIRAFLDNDLANAISEPILFTGASPRGNAPSSGFEAVVLQELCELLLEARDAGALQTEQERRYAQFADMLIRSFARVGIIALVDEATGYQRDRAKDALARILEDFIAKELRPWVHTFPDDFYSELFRLRGLEFPRDNVKRPQYFGHLTNDIVYRRLAPGVLDELRRQTPRRPDGRFKHQLFRRLTDELGHPKLREHLASVIALMKVSRTYRQFQDFLDRVHPRYGETPMLPFLDEPITGL